MLKKLFISLISIILLSITINAQDKQMGKFLGTKSTIMPSWFSSSFLDLSEDIEELSTNNKRLILFIEQDSCPYCHAFVTKNLQDKQIKNKIQKHFGMIDINMFGNKEMIDIDEQELIEKEFAIKHKIQFTPTLIFFDENKNQILRLNGYIDIPQFNLALDYIKDKKEKELSYEEYLLKNTKKISKKLIIDADLFKNSKNLMRTDDSNKMAIFFETSNCVQCQIIHNKLLKDKTTRELLKKLDLYQIDLNSDNSIVTPQRMIVKIKDWAKELNITHIPTIIFFDKKGDEIIRVEAILKNYHFQSIVDYVASNAFKEEKEFQRYLTKRSNSIREKGIDINIWE